MERKRFIEICQRVSILTSGMMGIKKDVPIELQVEYQNRIFYPTAYTLQFDDSGKPHNRVTLHELTANSVTMADLNDVEEVQLK